GELTDDLRKAAGVRIYLQPPRAEVKAEGPSIGNPNAPVTIVEFSDFECPFCGRAVETVHKIQTAYGDKVRIVFRDFPLVMHRTAKRAAEASHCAEEQGKFWEMHDKLFSKGGPITDADLYRFAQQIKLDHDAFDTCLQSGKFRESWKPSQDEGMRVGVQSTPTFFINGRLIVGAASFELFSKVIDDELAYASQQPKTKVASK
ncbi:MAG TPA: DsbA family protein, partial [Candidatus Solibacter sp.]|nr:DsbA family protein [Candidatus Solibacter sp.]